MFDADIIKVIEEHGDCAVADTSGAQIKRIEYKLGYKLELRNSTVFPTGYVIYKTDKKIIRRGPRKNA